MFCDTDRELSGPRIEVAPVQEVRVTDLDEVEWLRCLLEKRIYAIVETLGSEDLPGDFAEFPPPVAKTLKRDERDRAG